MAEDYVLSAHGLKCLKAQGYKLECDWCGEPVKEGDLLHRVRGDRFGKVLFHKACWEKRKMQVSEKQLYVSQPKPKAQREKKNPRESTPKIKEPKEPKKPKEPKTSAPRPLKIKSDVTVNLYRCNHCEKNVHAKVTRDQNGRIIAFYCEYCGELLMKPFTGFVLPNWKAVLEVSDKVSSKPPSI